MSEPAAPSLCCFQAIWPPDPIAHTVTAVEVVNHPLSVFTGAADGGIIKWSSPASSENPAEGLTGLRPSLFLNGHSAMVVAMRRVHAVPLADRAKPHLRELFSADRDGRLCVWEPRTGVCLRSRRLPPSCTSLGNTAETLRDGRHVVLVCGNSMARVPGSGEDDAPQRPHSDVGLVIVDAWTLAATQRLSPAFVRPSFSLAPPPGALQRASSFSSLEAASTQSFASATSSEGAPHGRMCMTSLKVFTPKHHDAEGDRPRSARSEFDEVLAQRYALGGWDARWEGMSVEEINTINQTDRAERESRGLMQQKLGVSCMVVGLSRDGMLFGWEVDDTIMVSTQAVDSQMSQPVLAAEAASSAGLLQWLAWSEERAPPGPVSPCRRDEPQADEADAPLKGPAEASARRGLRRSAAFSASGELLLVVHGGRWQLLTTHLAWRPGRDMPVYSKVVAFGSSPFRGSSIAGGLILKGSICPGKRGSGGLRRHSAGNHYSKSAEPGRSRGGSGRTCDRFDLRASPAARRCSFEIGGSAAAGEGRTCILLWSWDGAAVVLLVGPDGGEAAALAEFPAAPLSGGARAASVHFEQVGQSPLLLRVVTARGRRGSRGGTACAQQDTSVAAIALGASGAEGVAAGAWLSSAWGSDGCAAGNAAAPSRALAPSDAGGLSPPHSDGSVDGRAAPHPDDPPCTPHADEGYGRVTAVQLLGGDGLAPDTLVHGHANGLISVFPLASAMLPVRPMWMRPGHCAQREGGGGEDAAPGSSAGAPSEPQQARPVATLQGHSGRVLCFLEISHRDARRRHPGSAGIAPSHIDSILEAEGALLLSGGEDGSIRGWAVSQSGAGRGAQGPLFSVHAHTAGVRKLLLPPAGRSPPPWDSCVASIGNDGAVCIVSLVTLRVERVLPGHPVGSPVRVVWDPERGFMACLCLCAASELAAQSAGRGGSGSPRAAIPPDEAQAVADGASGDLAPSKSRYLRRLRDIRAASLGRKCLQIRNSLRRSTTSPEAQSPDRAAGQDASEAAGVDSAEGSYHGGADPYASLLEQEKLLVVWDLVTGKRDRVVTGVAADSLMQHFEEAAAEDKGSSADPHPGGVGSGGDSAATRGISVLRIDVEQLLAERGRQADRGLQGSAISSTASAGGASGIGAARHGDELGALVLALGLLHRWGLDAGTDLKVLRMLQRGARSACSPRPGSAAGDSGSCASGVILARGGISGEGGAATLQLPLYIDAPLGQRPWSQASDAGAIIERDPCVEAGEGDLRGGRGPRGGAAALCRGPQGAAPCASPEWWGDFWVNDPEYVRERLLMMTAMANRVMQLGSQSEAMCNGASAIVALYALRLQDGTLPIALPSLRSYAVLWQAPNPHIREAARSLLRAASGPTLGEAPFRLSPEMEEVVELWEATAPRVPSHAAIQRFALSVVVCGAACHAHWEKVPERLFRATAPLLAELAFMAPAVHSAAAASLLAEAFLGGGAERWKSATGNELGRLLERAFAVCERLGSAHLCHEPPAGSGAGGEPGGGGGEGEAHGGGVRGRIKQALRQGHSSAPPARADRRGTLHVASRDSVAAVIPAIAAADLQLFLHVVGQRLAGGVRDDSPAHMAAMTGLVRLVHRRPALVAVHLPLVVSVVLRALDPARPVLRRACMEGVSAVVKEFCMRFPMMCCHSSPAGLLLAVGSALPGIQPPDDAVRTASRPRQPSGLSPPESPSDASNRRLHSLLSARHPSPPRRDSGEASQEVVAIYDMATGQKRRALILPTGAQLPSPGVSAAAFSPDGQSFITFSAYDGCLRMWSLASQWTYRWSKGTTMSAPQRQQELLDPKHLPPPFTSGGQIEMDYFLCWESSGHVVLSYGSNILGQFHMDSVMSGTVAPLR